ncbi:MAG: hypothetical protein AAFW89_10405 [Bacteroidota bacterium]
MKNLSSLLLLFLCSCGPTEFLKHDKNTSCSTTIEGELLYLEKHPATGFSVLEKKSIGKTEVLVGKIIEQYSDSVLFDEKRRSIAYDPKPKIYTNDQIVRLINGSGNSVLGEESEPALKTKRIDFVFKNESGKKNVIKNPKKASFSYCVSPGVYTIVEITRVRKNGDSDITWLHQAKPFQIIDGKANYIGSIIINSDSLSISQQSLIPLIMKSRPNKSAIAMQFGAIGGALYGLSLEKGAIDTLKVHVSHKNTFESISGLPLEKVPLFLDDK